MNATQEINGKLYNRVPAPDGRCTGCAFYTISHCAQQDRSVSCVVPKAAIFVEVADVVPEPDEQCGVGNG